MVRRLQFVRRMDVMLSADCPLLLYDLRTLQCVGLRMCLLTLLAVDGSLERENAAPPAYVTAVKQQQKAVSPHTTAVVPLVYERSRSSRQSLPGTTLPLNISTFLLNISAEQVLIFGDGVVYFMNIFLYLDINSCEYISRKR